MLGEAGCHGLVLLSALDLLQQPLPRQKGNSGNTAHLDSAPAGRLQGLRQPAPPRGGKGSAGNCLFPVCSTVASAQDISPLHTHTWPRWLFLRPQPGCRFLPDCLPRRPCVSRNALPQRSGFSAKALSSGPGCTGLGCTGLRLRLGAARGPGCTPAPGSLPACNRGLASMRKRMQ